MRTKKEAFTLVELIVVIVILAILATIAFLSFSSQSSSARDSTRMADMINIAKGLMVFSTIGGTYPIPEKSINIMSGAVQIGYQGEAGSKILGMIKFSAGSGKDPINGTYYTYNTNNSRTKVQILGFLETQALTSFNPIKSLDKSFATDYIGRYPYEKGDSLGVILVQTGATSTPTFTPLQDTIPAGSGFDTTSIAQSSGKVVLIDNSNTSPTSVSSVIFSGYTGTGNTTASGGTIPIIDSYTKLIIHGDNLSIPGTFLDSANSKIISKSGNATQTGAQYKFGNSSIYLDGASSTMLSLADNDDWDFGSGDFTIDFWIKTAQIGQSALIYQGDSNGISTTVSTMLLIGNDGKLMYYPDYVTYPSHHTITSTQPINDNIWHHVAIIRNGNYFRMYVDGAETGTALNLAWTIPNKTDQLSIGSMPGTNYYNRFAGYLDEIRISKGIARWSGNFAVPTTAY